MWFAHKVPYTPCTSSANIYSFFLLEAEMPLPLSKKSRLFSLVPELGRTLDRLPRVVFNRKTQILIDAVLSTLAIWSAYQLRFDFSVPEHQRPMMWTWALLLAVLRPLCMRAWGVYKGTWRYFDFHDARSFALGAIPPTILVFLLRIGSSDIFAIKVPLSVIVLDYGVFLMLGIGVRAMRRVLYESSLTLGARKRTLMVGSEAGLVAALRQVALNPDVRVIGLLAIDAELHGMRISGFKVLDNLSALTKHLASGEIDLVLIADADLESIGRTMETALDFGVEARLLPSAANIVRGEVRISTTAKPELAIAASGPDAIDFHPDVVETFRDRCALITGAGGSIGSELSRRVAQLPVASIVLLDQNENSIFQIHHELKSRLSIDVVPIVADIRDRDRIRSIFKSHRPHIVLHAAAYKHVPVMERNCSEAVLNNVLGTQCLAETAIEFGSERFLMISTDKAVDPTSIMGATKRMAELVVQRLAANQNGSPSRTLCACVRFGNVVGSAGSVAPIFLQQIANGGPITITDADMTRYFMTIPDAVHLVLQAATLGSNGEVYMLKMGDPLKIATLARRLIEMSGLRPGTDIEIHFIGARPGEKIHEKLWADGAQVAATKFSRVLNIDVPAPLEDFDKDLQALVATAVTRDEELTREIITKMPIGFTISSKTVQAEASANELSLPMPANLVRDSADENLDSRAIATR